MTRYGIAVAVAGLAVTGLAGCADPSATTHVVHLGHDESQVSEVSMRVGQLLSIVDDEFNASVGDGWTLTREPDATVLERVGEGVVLDEPDAVGGGGTYTLDYTAVGAGSTSVTLEYAYRGEPAFESTVRVTVD